MPKTGDNNMVNKAPHYNVGEIEVIDYLIDKFADDGLLFNVCKYISRSKHKGKELEDLEKAEYYLKKKIEELKKCK